MTTSEKETLGFVLAGGALAALYALQRRSGGGGLGQAWPASLTAAWDGTCAGGTSFQAQPGGGFYLNICGLAAGDWVEANFNPLGTVGRAGIVFLPGWSPQFSTAAAADAGQYVTGAPFASSHLAYGPGGINNPLRIFNQSFVAPSAPGSYQILYAVNGRLAGSLTLNVGGAPGAWAAGGGIPAGTPVAGFTTQPVTGPAATPATNPLALNPPATAATTAGPASAAGTAVVPMTVQNGTATTAPVGSFTGFLEGTVLGLPLWAVLAAGGMAVWYFTSKGE